jgi:hypothetical protein
MFSLIVGKFTTAGQLRVVNDGVNTTVEINLDSDKGAEMRIVVEGVHAASDLTFVF